MANFAEAIAKTELSEGGYSSNPSDSGGETYRGISRKNWPNWAGWPLIDRAKLMHDISLVQFPDDLQFLVNLQALVVSFYRENFWRYDGLNDQVVADKVFDLSVNVGRVHAVKILQQIVGVNADGAYGPKTEKAANLHPKGSLTQQIRAAAEQYHKQIVQAYPQDAIFLAGWLKRDSA